MKLKKDYLIIIPILIVVINMIFVATGMILVVDNFVYSNLIHNEILTKILLFITNFGSVKYIVVICILLLLFYKPKKELVNLYGVLIISTVINNVIKIIFRRPRPALMGSLLPVFEGTFSFPSGHAMASMTFYGYLIYMLYKKDMNTHLKKLLISLLFLLILAVGFSRIYIYVHYFSDVFTGFMCSIIVLYFYIKMVKKVDVLKSKRLKSMI